MSEEHVYISEADKAIQVFIKEEVAKRAKPVEVLELGSGPGRVTTLIGAIPDIRLTAIDHDEAFVRYGRKILIEKGISADMRVSNIETYKHPRPLDVIFSQGVHHHIKKGEVTNQYLKHIHGQLSQDGIFIVSDEFIPEYHTNDERKIRLVIWYSHVIAHALKDKHTYLAQEEAKTLLDDLNEGFDSEAIKNRKQIDFVLLSVQTINSVAEGGDVPFAESLAKDFLHSLLFMRNTQPQNDVSIDLSRGDYKISDSRFKKEAEAAGFSITDKQAIGPINTIGGLVVYKLRKKT